MPSPALKNAVKFFTLSVRPFANCQLIAAILIAFFCTPTVFAIPGTAKLSVPAAYPRVAQQLASFGTGVKSTFTGLVAGIFTSVSKISDLPTRPTGPERARVPAVSERLGASVTPILAYLTTTKAAPEPAPAPQPSAVVDFDFDGDGKADIGRWHSATTEFKIRKSSDQSYATHTIGSSSAVSTPGDFDGDGTTDAAVFSAGSWTIKKSSNGAMQTISFGASGDKPVVADYDGDGKSDAAVFRPSTNIWWVLRSSDAVTAATSHGSSGDIPVTGNWDGDAYADIAVFRPSTGTWYVLRTTAGALQVQWGLSTDIPVAADFDGDEKTDLAIYRPTTGAWWVMKSSTGFNGSYLTHGWGNYGDQPVPADYDGDGEADFAVWRPKTGVWYISKSSLDNTTYEYHGLGVAGDTAVPSSYLKQVGATVYGDDMAAARLSPKNATGGTNLYSQNFSWGKQLVGLPGRSGLDAGFGISYNSLVWTKLGTTMHFDVDQSNFTPGFRMGFATIEPAYYDDLKSLWAYVMVTPSGSRVEFRQTAVSNVYETADSGYTQLKIMDALSPTDPVENIGLEVTTTDGTVMSYEWRGGAYRCKQIKDRNGNYISINHDEQGLLRTLTDTLGRIITVKYDTLLYPTEITQTWRTNNGDNTGSTTEHKWATFSYTGLTLNTNFSTSLNIVGPPTGTNLIVLDKVTYADGTSTAFDYNGYAQVYKVRNIAADSSSHVLNYVRTNLQSPPTNQPDCPRFTETKSFVEDFNGGAETTVTNTITTGTQAVDMDGGNVPASMIQVKLIEHPNGNITNTYVHDSGWKEGLPIRVDDYANGNGLELKRSSWTTWTQDDVNANYIVNPRVTETKVGDGTNVKKSSIEYWLHPNSNVAQFGLVKSAFLFAADTSTVLKKTYTTYNLSPEYTSRRIIGLPSMTMTFGFETTGLNPMSKVTYAYDEGDFSDSGLSQNISPTQHKGTNYGPTFVAGRGNLTSITRWNVELGKESDSAHAITSSAKYNTAGAVVSQTTPWEGSNTRTVKIGYADSFNSSNNPTTYAYPTTVTDAGNNSSTVIYRYDLGSNVEATSPAPAGNMHGKKTKRVYDSKGRLERASVNIDTTEHAYTRYEYPANGIQRKVYSTIVDTNANLIGDSADEVLSESWTDGAGRVLRVKTEHPGSSGGWSAVKTEYDIAGRAFRQSVPTEVNATWNPYGEDAARGWVWNSSEFDWKDRSTRTVPSDSTGTDGKDTLISYEGCGCAGGLTTTVLGPLVPRDDDPQSNARRKLKLYEDILGRRERTETFAWDGGTVHSTVVNSFNGRDQVIKSRRYAGGASSSAFQDMTADFDGHGRLIESHRPEQMNSQESPLSTSYSYNPDGSIATVTDARGAGTSNVYNVSGLLTQRSSTMPGPSPSPMPDPNPNTSVTLEYDNLGNRTKMTDSLGTVDYEYNQLSQIVAETRQFTDTMSQAPLSGNRFKLEYSYTLSGQLKWYKDPFGQQINHEFDRTGKLTDITGTSFGGVTSYADGAEYRAWGALKDVGYGSGMNLALTYNNRLQTIGYSLDKPDQTAIIDKVYNYYSDGKQKYSQDLINAKFDRLNSYNAAGKISQGKSGGEARGETVPEGDRSSMLPYRQSYAFDAFGNLTGSTSLHWGETSWDGQDFDQVFDYENNRIDETFWTYDDDGRNTRSVTATDDINRTFDAAGRLKRTLSYHVDTRTYHDGEGKEIKRRTDARNESGVWEAQPTKYYIRSSVLGGRVVSDVWANGKKHRSYVKGIGSQTAVQSAYASEAGTLNEVVLFEFSDASGMSYRTTNKLGEHAATGDGGEGSPIETDPLGGNVGTYTPFLTLVVPFDPEYPELQTYNNGYSPASNFSSLYATFGSRIADLPGFGTNWGSFAQLEMAQYEERLFHARRGEGFITAEQWRQREYARAAFDMLATIFGGGASSNGSGESRGDDGTRSGGDETGGNGEWVDQTTADVDLENNTVSIYGNGYFDFGSARTHAQNDTYTTPTTLKGLREAVTGFFVKHGRAFRRCVWGIFSKDRDGSPSNVAEIMKTPSSDVFPYDKFVIAQGLPHQGMQRGTTGDILFRPAYRSSNLFDGTYISAQEQFSRTLAHEYANYLSWFYTGDGATFGVKEGILGDGAAAPGLQSANTDDDTGARMEKCIWGNVSY